MAKFISWNVCARASTSLREESILLRADETPADGRFVNRSFFRGMDVTILAQKTLLYCAHATRHPWCPAVPTRQDKDSRRDSIQPPPTLQASGTPASGGSTYGHSEAATRELQPWGPRGEDQPWVDTPGKTRTHASLLSRQCHVDGSETKWLPQPAIGGEHYRMMGKGTCTSNG
ncbi:hypothetical protein GQ55_1G060400 [Panicum hallii var. hallii]|uniref:Uncharacterized protein n=1 Tax=Panicum hallii var. hallii TaxID=1504633 RepID=A0A2T7F2R8_9POAL|nr:hypothetical protein GQ55_1G060400 [Panicum hallii var. hallii]